MVVMLLGWLWPRVRQQRPPSCNLYRWPWHGELSVSWIQTPSFIQSLIPTFSPLLNCLIWACRRPPRTRKGEEDKQSLTPSIPQGLNTRTSSGNNIFFHSAQGQAAAATTADESMQGRTMTLSSSSSSRRRC